ncbi:GntR family transcriptional regulator [Antarcticirhabdus aurantiaca]|uniref:GntR family transcriptional regulator n=1 Tax=Antarcticirhabdus aurantiaca TaxID=2606717 RepID=A0ACD4NHV2_9HYPH|nr:GntR family transcriptional regulator [Antarcticirhabdus aurantiaca]WAJ26382.1 GntR family transcriptional regulator [Jeongeuplla avenae]
MSLVRNKIFQMVRSEILSCELMPGMELREADLAKRYGVSKSPVRDAMQKLEFEGLVEIEPRRGHRVRPISVKDAEDILDLRIILDTGVVKRIVEIASADDLSSLDRYRTADMSSKEVFAKYNRQFHTALATLSGNLRLAEECRRVMEFYGRLCIVSLSSIGSGPFDQPLADHVQIIDALQARNASKAAKLVRAHIDTSRAQIMRGLQSRPIVG